MHFEERLEYDATPEAVYAMITDPAFREEVCRRMGATEHEVAVVPAGARVDIRVDQQQPTAGVPGFAAKLIGDHVEIVQREEWTGSGRASYEVTIPGRPGHLKGTITLAGDGRGGSVETFSGEVRVHVPLVGGKLEGLIAQLLHKALRTEGRTGRDWLAAQA